MTSLLAVLLIIAVAFVVAAIISLSTKNDMIAGLKRTIQDKRDDCNSYLDRWRDRMDQIVHLTNENHLLVKVNGDHLNEITRLAPYESRFHSATMEAQRQSERASRAESDSRTSRDAVQRGFNEFQELLSATRALVPAKVFAKGIEDGQSVKQIVLLHLQQLEERKAARRG